MRLSIVSQTNILYEGNVKEVLLPAVDEELCILDFHQPFLCRLNNGDISIKGLWLSLAEKEKSGSSNPELSFTIKSGVARMVSNELIIVVEK